MKKRIAGFVVVVILAACRIGFAQSGTGEDDEAFYASLYLGLAIDTFAAAEHLNYLNPNLSSGMRQRGVVGVDFERRLSSAKSARPLWVFGETVHGTRTTEINCNANKDLFVCKSDPELIKASLTPDPTKVGQDFLYILRNATSLEGFMGLRWEFMKLPDSNASLYIKGQAGFLTIAEDGRGAKDIHHVAFGAIEHNGRFRDSYLEVGFGRSDLFEKRRRQRWKIDAFLTRSFAENVRNPVGKFFARFQPFLQMTVDTDVGYGADSFQTYVGLDFVLSR